MKIIVAVVGKARHPSVGPAARDYEGRAAHYWPLEIHEVREESGRGASPDQVRDKEGARLIAVAGTRAHVVACDPGGTVMTSERFAMWLQREREDGRDVSFVIGGAHGLSAAVRAASRTRISLAPWTLSHELARLVLAEQLYRAGTIIRGEPYHK
ncbi:MAG: 23S rRNA (pseudouridine(1915)-N(3))-methyltransferase RlmH [Gemmatimonadetes bacterium]|nr:23S rRNA (pseudouridine(1915)-N(3))-methyltransferase RlmH [Gemmatimonadota bacterium]